MFDTNGIVELQETLYNSKNKTRRRLHITRKENVTEQIEIVRKLGKRKILEVGPGSGVYIPVMCRLYDNVTVVDIEQRHLNNVEKFKADYSNLDVVNADICSDDYVDKFDVILCSEVIEHVPCTKTFLNGLAKSLDVGGFLIISTPQKYSVLEICCHVALSPLFIRISQIIYKEPVLPTGHINLMTSIEMKSELVAAGFEVVSETRFGLYMPIIAEFFGDYGYRFIVTAEKVLNKLNVKWPLWTQLYVARKK